MTPERTKREKLTLHQVHPVKLSVDIAGSIASTYLFYRHQWIAALLVTFPPSILVSVILMRTADWDKLAASRLGRYAVGFMNHYVEAVRFLGQICMWISAWVQWMPGIGLGVLVIVGAWSWGILKRDHHA